MPRKTGFASGSTDPPARSAKPSSPDLFRQADAVFDAALDLPAHQRHAYVEQACAADTVLRATVQGLLLAHERADQFLAAPAAEIAMPLLGGLGPPLPARVGPFRIMREIGHGGMGIVYLAERDDGQFRQCVALKLVRGEIGGDYLVRRFLEERQILASLEHPGIARLVDGGVTPEGLPYFAMEYVEGEPVDRYCDRYRMSIDKRLQLFLEVCEAVQYAHRNLVVHRDLKPSNILVTEPATAERSGRVKLLDFGIAKLLPANGKVKGAALTQPGARLMTPEYASPEQIRGEAVTTASDVYALGVLLYELLTGCHPARAPGRTPREIERRILDEEPERPSAVVTRSSLAPREFADEGATTACPEVRATARGSRPRHLRRRLRGDLDTIVMQALRKEPERRYATAEQLADDLRRYFSSVPVSARRDRRGYRAAKFIRRNRLAVTVGFAIMLLIMASSAVAVVQAARLRAQAERIAQENQTAEQVTGLLIELFNTSEPGTARGQTVTARELLDRGAERVERELAGQPEVQARMLDAIGLAYGGLGVYDPAENLLERGVAIRDRLHGSDHADLATSMYNLATVRRFRGEFKAAEMLFHDALDMRRRLFGDQHPAVVESLNGLGFVLRGRGADAEAESVYRAALASGREVYGAPHLQIAVALNGLGSTLSDQGRFDDAVQTYRQALEMYLALAGEDHPETGVVLLNLGRTLDRRGEAGEAEIFLRRAADVSQRVQGNDHPVYALNLTLLADMLRHRRELDEAEVLYRRALQIQRDVLPGGHANTASTLLGLGRLLMDRGLADEAEPMLWEALRIREDVLVQNHWGTAIARNAVGACLSKLGRHAEAAPLLLDGFTQLRDALGAADPRTQNALRHLVDYYEHVGQADEAATYRAALLAP